MASSVIYEDQFGEVIDRPERGLIEIRWFDATRNFTTATFYEWLSEFAGGVEASGRQHVLVDALSFRMASDQMDPEWRDTHIIPRYNAAGVEKFAFLMPEGMPAIGTPPAPEGPAEFPTAYFGTRAEALAWLAV